MSDDTTIDHGIDSTRPSWQRHLSTASTLAVLGLFVYLLATGHLDYGNAWTVILGLAAPFVWYFLPGTGTRDALIVLAAGVLIYWALPAGSAEDGLTTGVLTCCAAFSALGLGVRFARHGMPWLRRRLPSDPALREAESGFDALEHYLRRSAEHLGPHTLAKMAGTAAEGRKIIGLSGYGGAGKDTAAAGLIFNRDYAKVSLSNKLREFLLAVDPIILVESGELDRNGNTIPPGYMRLSTYVPLVGDDPHDDWPRAKENPEVRTLLQRTGTDAGRRILGENVWVDACMRDLPDGPVVFTSVRFVNEAEAIKAQGGYLVRVERPGVGPVNDHPSETAMDGWEYDAYVLNEGDMKACREQMLNVESVLYDTKDEQG